MESLLNRALNFSLLSLKLDITEFLVDFNRFARAAIWVEYWFTRETEYSYSPQIFKTKKNNLPKNHSSPTGLKNNAPLN